MTVPRGRCRM